MNANPVARDGVVYVQADKCKTCIFRPGNLMHLKPGRVKAMVKEATQNESCIPCHNTLGPEASVCRGFFDKHATQPLQIAERLGLVKYT